MDRLQSHPVAVYAWFHLTIPPPPQPTLTPRSCALKALACPRGAARRRPTAWRRQGRPHSTQVPSNFHLGSAGQRGPGAVEGRGLPGRRPQVSTLAWFPALLGAALALTLAFPGAADRGDLHHTAPWQLISSLGDRPRPPSAQVEPRAVKNPSIAVACIVRRRTPVFLPALHRSRSVLFSLSLSRSSCLAVLRRRRGDSRCRRAFGRSGILGGVLSTPNRLFLRTPLRRGAGLRSRRRSTFARRSRLSKPFYWSADRASGRSDSSCMRQFWRRVGHSRRATGTPRRPCPLACVTAPFGCLGHA